MSADIKKLPVFETVGQSITFAVKNLGLMVRLSWLWGVVVGVVSGALIFVLLSKPAGAEEQSFAGSDVLVAGIFFLVYFAAAYSIAVGWHRALLLGERPGWINLRFGRPELGYFGYAIVIALICLLPAFVGFLIFMNGLQFGNQAGDMMTIVAFIGIFVGGYLVLMMIFSRLFVVLPGIAVGDRRISLVQSFKLTRGNTWRIFSGLVLITFLEVVPNLLTKISENVPDNNFGLVVSIILLILSLLISVVVVFVVISYMSYCYWFFVPSPEEGDLA